MGERGALVIITEFDAFWKEYPASSVNRFRSNSACLLFDRSSILALLDPIGEAAPLPKERMSAAGASSVTNYDEPLGRWRR